MIPVGATRCTLPKWKPDEMRFLLRGITSIQVSHLMMLMQRQLEMLEVC